METPSSTRRVTRSQTLAGLNNNNNNIPISSKGICNECIKIKAANRQTTKALVDITNDSPIVGLATGSLETPSSMAKLRQTPGSGEALLRGQVKALLQKIEEEAELSKLSLENRQFLPKIQAFTDSPIGILAPTPANTPHILNLSADSHSNKNFPVQIDANPSPIQEQLVKISEEVVVSDVPGVKKNDCWITRSLLLDFSEKSDSSDSSDCSSVVTELVDKSSSPADDDDASIWSIQVNASTKDDEDVEEFEEEDEKEEEEDYEKDYGDEDHEGGGLVDELCEGMNKMNVNAKPMIPKFTGIHKRFVYNEDDELVAEEIVVGEEEQSKETEDSVLHLKGLPRPKGNHLRFQEDEEEEN
ncbi:hypothetical protein RJ641_010690 [Dillenia turbinata]|uniref:Uncharacterized protein n=1 Tax=Dillenia turbinata TaxID=194707 RepID=A0AAN8UYT9_9MAGN